MPLPQTSCSTRSSVSGGSRRTEGRWGLRVEGLFRLEMGAEGTKRSGPLLASGEWAEVLPGRNAATGAGSRTEGCLLYTSDAADDM
eukprot:3556505-Prymnesium_polylepis.1